VSELKAKDMKKGKDYLDGMAEVNFLHKINLLQWEAAQWIQFVDYDIDENDMLNYNFKSSSYGVKFTISRKVFTGDAIDIKFDDAYQFFKSIKYGKAKRNF